MTLQQFRFRIARRFDLSPSVGDDRQLIDDWLYEGILDFARRAKINLQLAELGLSAGVGDYELSQDVLAFEDVWVEQSATNTDRLLEPVDSGEIQRRRQFEVTTDAGVMLYAVEGENLIMIYPNADSASDVLHMLYVPKPSKMDSQDDSPSSASFGQIPEEFHPVLESYVKAQGADHTRDWQAGELYRQRYEEGLKQAKMETTRKGGMVVSRARVGRRTRRFPVSPGVDLGG